MTRSQNESSAPNACLRNFSLLLIRSSGLSELSVWYIIQMRGLNARATTGATYNISRFRFVFHSVLHVRLEARPTGLAILTCNIYGQEQVAGLHSGRDFSGTANHGTSHLSCRPAFGFSCFSPADHGSGSPGVNRFLRCQHWSLTAKLSIHVQYRGEGPRKVVYRGEE